jgi:hypothetical protein
VKEPIIGRGCVNQALELLFGVLLQEFNAEYLPVTAIDVTAPD